MKALRHALIGLLLATLGAQGLGLNELARAGSIVTQSRGGFGGSTAPNVPAPVGESLAPTEITNYTAVAGVATITHSFDQSGDQYDTANGQPASGMTSYRIETSGGTLIQNVSAPAANIQAQPTFINIGAGSASTSISGNDRTITAAGAGINGTSDQIGFAYTSVSGDFKYTTKVHSHTGSSQGYASCGPMLRESTAGGSKYLVSNSFQTSEAKAVQAKGRTIVNTSPYDPGAGGNFATAAGLNTASWQQVERVSNTFTWRYSYDNITWHELYTASFAFNSTLLVGDFADSEGGTATTCIFRGSKLTPVARVSYTQSTVSAVTSHVLGFDVGGYSTGATQNLTTTPLVTPPPDSNLVSWHPGYGVSAAITDGGTNFSTASSQWAQMAPYDSLFKFGNVFIYISKFYDGTTYDWTVVDQCIDYLKNPANFTTPKRFSLELQITAYGRTSMSGTNPFPASWVSNGWTKLDTINSAWYLDLENPAAMAAYKTVLAALGAHLNSVPTFEMFSFSETALYNRTQIVDAASYAKTQFPNKNVHVGHNYLVNPNSTDDKNLAAAIRTYKLLTGGPDSISAATSNGETFGQLAHRGVGVVFVPAWGATFDFGTVDNRGAVGNFLQRQQADFGMTDMQIAAYAQSQKATHFAWLADGSGGHTFANAVAAATAYPVYTGCPTVYAGLCDTH